MTPPGNYTILEKDADHRSNIYGDFVNPGLAGWCAQASARSSTPHPAELFTAARQCAGLCGLAPVEWACTPASYQAIPPPTVAFACPRKSPGSFTIASESEPR